MYLTSNPLEKYVPLLKEVDWWDQSLYRFMFNYRLPTILKDLNMCLPKTKKKKKKNDLVNRKKISRFMVSFLKFQGSKINFNSIKNCLICQHSAWSFGFIKNNLIRLRQLTFKGISFSQCGIRLSQVFFSLERLKLNRNKCL